MTRRTWHIVMGRNSAFVRGHGSREMLAELKRRPPMWSRAQRAWSCQPKTARDLIALAETRGIDLVITGGEE